MKTRKQYDSKIGPSMHPNLPALGGPRENLEWTFSDGISEFSKTNEIDVSEKSVDGAFGLNIQTDGFNSAKHSRNTSEPPLPKKKKAKKKGKKKSKNRKGAKSSTNKPNLDFYRRKGNSQTNSSVPEASNIPTPKFRKNRGKKNIQSISPRRATNRYNSNSIEDEGGSRATSYRLSNPPEEFWNPSPSAVGKMNYFRSPKGKKIFNIQKSSAQKHGSPNHRNRLVNAGSSVTSRSVPRTEGYRDCVISPRVQDKDYIAEQAENSAFKRQYKDVELSFSNQK